MEDGYATCADFCKVFNDNVDRLYTLALLLTADREMAEYCFLSAFENCIDSKTVFREWAESWAKRTTIITAIRIVFSSQIPANVQIRAESNEWEVSAMEALVARMSNLTPFDRFVYVMSVFERMSVKECALLLGCSSMPRARPSRRYRLWGFRRQGCASSNRRLQRASECSRDRCRIG